MPRPTRVTAHGKRRNRIDAELLIQALILIATDLTHEPPSDNRRHRSSNDPINDTNQRSCGEAI